MEIVVFPDADTVARRAATLIADMASQAIARRGQFTFAASGGSTPWLLMRYLAEQPVRWEHVHFFQVDERVAPDGDASRNWTHLNETLLSKVNILESQLHPMPVTLVDLAAAASRYSATLREVAGTPCVLDLVHLGLGVDGHTASLVPDDPVLSVMDTDVAITEKYQNQRRVTLTFPLLNRARNVLWVVAGADKRDPLDKLLNGDRSIPAGRVNGARATVLADNAAIGSPTHE